MISLSNENYIPDLKALWKACFGDEDGFINLFFETEFKKTKSFAYIQNGRAVSALYLLPITLKLKGELFEGYYLYAAATEKSQRGKGLMRLLIEGAQRYAEKEGKSFVALVPGEPSLYSYYSRFGFFKAMYKSKAQLNFAEDRCKFEPITRERYISLRNECLQNAMLWGAQEINYALDCLNYYYKIKLFETDDLAFIYSEEASTVFELLTKKTDAKGESSFKEKTTAFSNSLSKAFERLDFGMIWLSDESLRSLIHDNEIYMNLALD